MIGEDATHLTTSYAVGERKCTEYGLLFFLGNIFKFKVQHDIILLCSDFYTADEVAETRKVMYAELKNLNEAKIFRVARRGARNHRCGHVPVRERERQRAVVLLFIGT